MNTRENTSMRLLGLSVLLIVCVCLNMSCRKYLDERSSNNLKVPTTLQDLQELLDNGDLMNLDITPSLGESSSDNIFLTQALYDVRPDTDKDFYRWIPTQYGFSNDWARGYFPVYNSNYCLEQLEEIPRTSANSINWDNVKGSALFYRAYNFLNLVWNYGKAYGDNSNTDLGIALRKASDVNIPSERATVQETYVQIINDAKESLLYLPVSSIHNFRPSRVASYGLLARTYLSMRMYDSAYRYADLSLQLKSDLIDFNQSNTADFATPGSTFPVKRFNKETIFYTETNLLSGFISMSRYRVDTLLYGLYTATDIRKTAFFTQNPTGSNYYTFKGSYSGGAVAFTGIATDEMYLIKAECLARAGDKDAAISTVNTLLFKRHTAAFTGLTAGSASEALDKILLERRKELLIRGLRWMDIKRLNKEGRNIVLTRLVSGQTYTLQPNANYYALPLPTDIINLTGMPQNPYP